MSTREASYRPAHEYFFGSNHQVEQDQLLEATRRAQEILNSSDTDDIYLELWNSLRLSPNGVPYSIVHGEDNDYSRHMAVAVQLPYANRLTPIGSPQEIAAYKAGIVSGKSINLISWNALTKHRFLFEAMKIANVRDEYGKPLPVIVVSAPSGDHRRQFTAEQKASIARSGDFTPFAEEVIEIARSEGYEQIVSAGYSLGAMVVPEVQRLSVAKSIESCGLIMAEPAYRLGAVATARAFMNFGPRGESDNPHALTEDTKSGGWIDGSPRLITDLEGTDKSWVGNIFADIPSNLAVVRGLGRMAFLQRFVTAIDTTVTDADHMPPTTFAYSQFSRLSAGVEDALKDNIITRMLLDKKYAQRIVADGHSSIDDQHGFGENHQYYTDMMLRGILFAFDDRQQQLA